jgi:hypothetical protein
MLFFACALIFTQSWRVLKNYRRLEDMQIFGVKPKIEDIKSQMSDELMKRIKLIQATGSKNAREKNKLDVELV